MKHIKPFNEANVTGQFLTDLREFCEMNLVYLMDDGLQVSVVKHPINRNSTDNHLAYVTLRYPLAATWDLLVYKSWGDIKDVIIPFFTRLNRQYNVITFNDLPFNTSTLVGDKQVQFTSRWNLVDNRLADQNDRQYGFRNNFTLDDIISDKLDLGNNFIVEIRFFVSCNETNDVIIPVKKSIGSRIKKFLGFDGSHLR